MEFSLFRDRPLTWLFLIATACVDLATIAPKSSQFWGAFRDLRETNLLIGIPGQLTLVAIWSATGKGHRLARGATLTLAVFLAVAWSGVDDLSPWREFLTFAMAHSLIVCVGMLILRLLGWLRYWPHLTDRPDERYQFSLVELFGWTCIVAIWSLGCRYASLDDDSLGIFLANLSLLPLVFMFSVCNSKSTSFQILVVLLLGLLSVVLAWSSAIAIGALHGLALLMMSPGQFAYLAAWYLVQRMDDNMVRERLRMIEDE